MNRPITFCDRNGANIPPKSAQNAPKGLTHTAWGAQGEKNPEKIAAALDRSTMTVKTALSELEDAGLIERRRSGFSKPNRIYVKLPPDGQKTFQVADRNPSSIGTENCPTDGKKIVP